MLGRAGAEVRIFDRPPRRRLDARQRRVVMVVVGLGSVVFGILSVTGPQIDYAPGDLRGTAAYNLLTGGLALVVGLAILLYLLRSRRS